ncbi:5e3cbcd5-3bf8-4696-8549-0be4f18fe5fd-CDS [Sclerotinia trifoliorum]|uniref:5e3cbcd5-3bf8-4696-8549-0be4f18fe5fd-CDS n=1 Tax=Sclerotinia trifoliorum TaxID=28548 RepID=A0A8H2ZP25_9HELO|nr:5e3cbcd5-3bf8-4696-8549-0be4f18fe5fd-CDS [Sclerotinia trifoliorum]
MMNTSSRCPNVLASGSAYARSFLNQVPSRSFSLTPPQNARRATRARRSLFRWLGTQGENFRNPLANSTNYMNAYNNDGKLKRVIEAAANSRKDGGPTPESENEPDANGNKELPPQTSRDMIPFPGNRKFISQPVLGEELRELIWRRIMQDARSVREVSAELGVEMSRVGAVVRLKEIEKEWERLGKPLARPYADAVMSMVPVTQLNPAGKVSHESINDLPIHVATGQQIFHPTSESRHFTREDAAKIFDERLLPADKRIPHPELIEIHKDFRAGLSREERIARQDARDQAEDEARQLIADRKAREEAKIKKVNTARWEFRIKEINVDDIGKDGRGAHGTGWRYGRPLMDRKRGQVKIPTSVQ